MAAASVSSATEHPQSSHGSMSTAALPITRSFPFCPAMSLKESKLNIMIDADGHPSASLLSQRYVLFQHRQKLRQHGIGVCTLPCGDYFLLFAFTYERNEHKIVRVI